MAGVSFTDAKLQAQLRDYLRVIADARSKEKRSVYIDSTRHGLAAGDRQLHDSDAGLEIELPADLRREGGGPTLEGWAIVDNTTGDDWNKVQLALVSGRPVSFISQLYEPRYRQRPTAELPEDRETAPVVYEGALEAAPSAGLVAGAIARDQSADRPRDPIEPINCSKFKAMAAAPARRRRRKWRMVAPIRRRRRRLRRGKLGELFEYRFSAPVTVRRGESAMLPFIQQKLDARKLLVYSDLSSANPMNAAELTNSTGKTLDGGPITVYDGGVYAGEALMETLKIERQAAHQLWRRSRHAHHDQVRHGQHGRFARSTRNRGVLTLRSATQETRTYTIKNADQKAKTLIVQHPSRDQYKLIGPKAIETTPTGYRFEVKLAAGATERLPVVEEHEFSNSVLLANLNPDLILSYTQNKALSEAGRKQLQQVIAIKRQTVDIDAQLNRTRAEIASLERDQTRIRQNIDSLNRVSGQNEQVQKYARTLADLDVKMTAARDRERELDDKRASLQSELNSLLDKIEF